LYENETIHDRSRANKYGTKYLRKLLRKIAIKEKEREMERERERGRGKVREFETQDLSTRILSRQLLSTRGVNVIGWIIANHPVCVCVCVYMLPLEISWLIHLYFALWQIDSANLLYRGPDLSHSILHIRCEFSLWI